MDVPGIGDLRCVDALARAALPVLLKDGGEAKAWNLCERTVRRTVTRRVVTAAGGVGYRRSRLIFSRLLEPL